jgi:RimJ/RimL family protein N-acetyltransferase
VVIETARLRLRPLTAHDLAEVHGVVLGDPAVTWDGRARSVEESREALAAKLHHVEVHGFGMQAVTDREDGAFLGWAGLQHLEGGADVELGYYLGRPAWGRGLATELARALVAHGFDELGLERIVAVVRPDNAASRRVLAKAGLHPAGTGHHYGADVELWVIDLSRPGASPAPAPRP